MRFFRDFSSLADSAKDAVYLLGKIANYLRRMPNQSDLDNVLAELKQAISDAADRVNAKLSDLASRAPGFQDEIAGIQSDISALNNIAPATVTTTTTTDGTGATASGTTGTTTGAPTGDGTTAGAGTTAPTDTSSSS